MRRRVFFEVIDRVTPEPTLRLEEWTGPAGFDYFFTVLSVERESDGTYLWRVLIKRTEYLGP